jgi:hypothetical protein
MNELLKNKVFLAFLGLVGLVIVCVIINNLTKTTTEDGEEIGALSAFWRRFTKKDVVKKDDTDDDVDDVDDDVVDDDVVDDEVVKQNILSNVNTYSSNEDEKILTSHGATAKNLLRGDQDCDSYQSDVTIEQDESGNLSSITTNNIPNHDLDGTNNGIYAACPSSQVETHTFIKYEACEDGKYWDTKNKKCTGNIETSPHKAQFGSLGILGRPITDGHWSEENIPIEVVDYDPTPAECWDVEAHSCGDSSDSIYRYNIYGANQWSGDKLTFENDETMSVDVDKFRAHVQPVGDTGNGVYHYHPPPLWDDGTFADQVIGYLYDGIPIMGYGSTVGTKGETATSSYGFSDFDNKSGFKCEGSNQDIYHSCYKFDQSIGNLDRYSGGWSPALGQYAYFSTGTEYPYLPIFIRGGDSSNGEYDN